MRERWLKTCSSQTSLVQTEKTAQTSGFLRRFMQTFSRTYLIPKNKQIKPLGQVLGFSFPTKILAIKHNQQKLSKVLPDYLLTGPTYLPILAIYECCLWEKGVTLCVCIYVRYECLRKDHHGYELIIIIIRCVVNSFLIILTSLHLSQIRMLIVTQNSLNPLYPSQLGNKLSVLGVFVSWLFQSIYKIGKHAAHCLHRLLLIVIDGRPNDNS